VENGCKNDALYTVLHKTIRILSVPDVSWSGVYTVAIVIIDKLMWHDVVC